MRTLWLYGHQLTDTWRALHELDPSKDCILLVEARSRGQWLHYHKQKLIFVYAAMRNFAVYLQSKGYQVDYREADTFEQGVFAHIHDRNPQQIILHLPTEWTMRTKVRQWADQMKKIPQHANLEITLHTEDEMFLVSESEWPDLLPQHKKWNLEQVYRKLRVRYNILMDGNQPAGGEWNYDHENRKGPNKNLKFIPPMRIEPDSLVNQVMAEVEQKFTDHPGQSSPFIWPVTKSQAEAALQHFLEFRLATFGLYQDAMLADDPFMSHSLLATALNFGLLHPLDVIRQVETAYRQGHIPLSAAEGFIRQVLGWREYVRGVYLLQMPEYAQMNALEHHRPLPDFYWSGQTHMACIRQAVLHVNRYAYSHHIQRLMVLCNFANLAGISPQAVSKWFNEMYIDALDWVVLPNVLGMGLYADGGIMSSKPYISSGKYIERMSDSCQSCAYEIEERIGARACPFHALYWTMIDRHQEKWQNNPRMSMMVKNWRNMDAETQEQLRFQADYIHKQISQGTL